MNGGGPVKVTPDPDGAWCACQLCQVTILAHTAEQQSAFLAVHEVEPDPAWLHRMGEVAADG